MMYIMIYIVIGIVLGLLGRVEDDEIALFCDGLRSVAAFVFLWPLIVLMIVDKVIRNGVTLRVKGKEVWRSKGRR